MKKKANVNRLTPMVASVRAAVPVLIAEARRESLQAFVNKAIADGKSAQKII